MTADHQATVRLEANGHEFNVLDVGTGRGVLMLHGFPDSHALWRHQVPKLVEAGYRVIAPDLRGFGESSKPEGVPAYAFGELLGDLRGIMRALGVPRAHVVGHDWGAALAWMFALTQPKRVDRLVAISVGHPAAFREGGIRQLQRSWYMLLFQFEGVAEEIIQRNDWAMLRAMFSDGDIESYTRDLARPGALTAALNWYRANINPTIMFAEPVPFPAIEAPTMGIWSDGDFALGEDQMVNSARQVSGPWRYERVEGVGHYVPLGAADRVTALLLDFFHQPDEAT